MYIVYNINTMQNTQTTVFIFSRVHAHCLDYKHTVIEHIYTVLACTHCTRRHVILECTYFRVQYSGVSHVMYTHCVEYINHRVHMQSRVHITVEYTLCRLHTFCKSQTLQSIHILQTTHTMGYTHSVVGQSTHSIDYTYSVDLKHCRVHTLKYTHC